MRRRWFLKGLIGSGVLILGGGGLLALRRGKKLYTADKTLRVLDERGFSVVVEMAKIILPAAVLSEADALSVARGVDESLSYASPATQRDFPRLVALFDNALTGFLLGRGTQPFSSLERAEKIKALEGWRDSRHSILRGGYHSMRKLILGVFYADLDRAKAAGYPGPPFLKAEAAPVAPFAALSRPYHRKEQQ